LSFLDSTYFLIYNEVMSLSSPGPGLYPISVVSELTGIGAHTLRGYERAGLLRPPRTDGGVRRYSGTVLVTVRRIAALSGEGINLAGIRRILALEAELAVLRAQLDAPHPRWRHHTGEG
jgi:MerR family transcriptional regulator/heat shock protein HspR